MPRPALNQSTSRTLHRHQEGEAGSGVLGSATRTPDPITRATRSPHSGHQQPHRRHTRQETSKLCDSFSTYDIRAVLMTAAWAPTTRQTAPVCSPTPLGPVAYVRAEAGSRQWPTSRSYLRARVRGVEGTNARPKVRTRGRFTPLSQQALRRPAPPPGFPPERVSQMSRHSHVSDARRHDIPPQASCRATHQRGAVGHHGVFASRLARVHTAYRRD